jgi:hypothetical protein
MGTFGRRQHSYLTRLQPSKVPIYDLEGAVFTTEFSEKASNCVHRAFLNPKDEAEKKSIIVRGSKGPP